MANEVNNDLDYYIHYYSQNRREKGIIDFRKGLGRFLVNSGVLPNRILLEPDVDLVVEPGYTYRRYVFDPGVRRFMYDFEFTAEDFEEGRLKWVNTVKGRSLQSEDGLILHSQRELGVYNAEADLNIILSCKKRY